jgi:hypothetical protein
MFKFMIEVPFSATFKSLFCKTFSLTENKSLEVESFWQPSTIIVIDLHRVKYDHAGFYFEFGLLGLSLSLNFYDRRHWNWDEDRFMTDEEIAAENEYYLRDSELREEFDEWKKTR